MSFFKRHPKFWAAAWAFFGFAGALMSVDALSVIPISLERLANGLIAFAVAVMMISYLLPAIRISDAQD